MVVPLSLQLKDDTGLLQEVWGRGRREKVGGVTTRWRWMEMGMEVGMEMEVGMG